MQQRVAALTLLIAGQLCLLETPSALLYKYLRHLGKQAPCVRVTDSSVQERSEAGGSVAGVKGLPCQPFAHFGGCP
jgi:hypothetical protein